MLLRIHDNCNNQDGVVLLTKQMYQYLYLTTNKGQNDVSPRKHKTFHSGKTSVIENGKIFVFRCYCAGVFQ